VSVSAKIIRDVDLSRHEAGGNDGALIENGERLRFTRDVEFSSPSMAAAVAGGGHVNGLTF